MLLAIFNSFKFYSMCFNNKESVVMDIGSGEESLIVDVDVEVEDEEKVEGDCVVGVDVCGEWVVGVVAEGVVMGVVVFRDVVLGVDVFWVVDFWGVVFGVVDFGDVVFGLVDFGVVVFWVVVVCVDAVVEGFVTGGDGFVEGVVVVTSLLTLYMVAS